MKTCRAKVNMPPTVVRGRLGSIGRIEAVLIINVSCLKAFVTNQWLLSLASYGAPEAVHYWLSLQLLKWVANPGNFRVGTFTCRDQIEPVLVAVDLGSLKLAKRYMYI